MVVVIGGVGTVHDAVITALLRDRGLDAVALGPLDADALATGRSLLPRGYPAPSYGLAGALVTRVRDVRARVPHARIVFVSLSAHCGHRAHDYEWALSAAGLREVQVVAPSLAELAQSVPAVVLRLPTRALLDAAIAGDILVRLGCEVRAHAVDAAAVERRIAESVHAIAGAIVHGGVDVELRRVADDLRAMSTMMDRAPIRVRITGEFVPSNRSGDLGASLVERIEALGAVAQPPLVTDWLLYALWQLGSRFDRLRRTIAARFRRRADAARCAIAGPDDPADLALLAGDLYSSDLRGGAGHLETGVFLKVDGNDLADLVVSVKAFASTPSSSVSDAVIHALARRARTGFLAIESTGEGEAYIGSRLELAIDMARARRAARLGAVS